MILRILLGLIPVCLFLGSLVYLDSYKLVRFRRIVQLIACGGLAAAVSYLVNQTLAGAMEQRLVMRFAAPLLEEMLKCIPVVFLLREKRVGFLVDAAIYGFAIGTGFALIENLYYLAALPDSPLTLWIVRGFGTAVLHGATTAIVAMMTKALAEKRQSDATWLVLPGFLIASIIHSFFNFFVLSPVLSTIVVVVFLPPVLIVVFAQSERYLQSWLGVGFDLDADLLRALRSGEFTQSRPGRYLQSLRDHFDGAVLADMLCYVRLQTELALRAKGLLMMRENGFPVRPDPETLEKLKELRFLLRSIGRTGQLALKPLLHRSSHDLWQLELLESAE